MRPLACWILSSIPFLMPCVAEAAESTKTDDGFVEIFDGKTLDGWDGDPQFWSVQDGCITGQTTADRPTKGNTFIIWKERDVADFELKLEYRIVDGNSGIQYRSFRLPEGADRWRIGGYQADLEAGDRYSGICYGEAFRGILADRGEQAELVREGGEFKKKVTGSVGDQEAIGKQVKKEDWNEYHITARGFHFIHRINGTVTCELVDNDKKMRRDSGVLALQLHQGPPMKVQFRKIRLKKISREAASADAPTTKKVIFVAGKKSHGYGAHEHYAGCALLARSLQDALPNFETEVIRDGWPRDESRLKGADCVVMYADGGKGHPAIPHLQKIDALADEGVGLVFIHYAVEVPAGEPGDAFLKWMGGYFEMNWSVNPHWTAHFDQFPDHPITRGVEPFSIRDEWYYHMRFRKNMEGVTPILTDLPGPETLARRDGPHSGNPDVRRAILQQKQPQHVGWASTRPDGGRGFGFTGGHDHWNWGEPNFRKVVLNAIVWCAQGQVPEDGVGSAPVTLAQLEQNQDEPPREDFDREAIRSRLGLSSSQ